MRDLKNIDRIFQENLKDFEAYPPNKAWSTIESHLPATPKKRHTPIWLKISSIAALLALLFSVGTIYLLPSPDDIIKNKLPEENKLQKVLKTKDALGTNTTLTKVNSTKSKSSIDTTTEFDNEDSFTTLNSITEETSKDNLEESSLTKKQLNRYYLADGINLPLPNTSNKDILGKDISEKFTVATIFAPIYINSFGDGSGVDAQFKGNPTSGNSSYSYGVKIAYQLNNKFSVQSGIHLINLGYTTGGVYVAPGISDISFSSLSSNPILSKNETISSKGSDNSGSLNQVFGYVEIPVEIKYSMTNGKFGVNLVGGFSTLLLNKDEVFVEFNDLTQSLGASNNLRSINFSGNIGVDIDYSIKKNLYINISPMFKVQTNTFSKNSGNIQPYYLGVYTGLNYKF